MSFHAATQEEDASTELRVARLVHYFNCVADTEERGRLQKGI
jgi:hypothetical protein